MRVEFTYAIFAMIAAVISFSIVKVNINFGYYFFVMTRAFANSEVMVHQDALTFSLGKLRMMVYLSLVGPLLIIFVFIDELAYNMIKGHIESVYIWQLIRLLPVFMYAGIRVALYRDEVQF